MATTFQQAYDEAARPAAPELAELFSESLRVIRTKYPHHEATVDTIEAHLGDRAPTLLEVLVGAWLLNGGVVLKQRLDSDCDSEMDALFDEISRLSTDEPRPS